MGGKTRGRKRTASLIGLTACKKVCSVADTDLTVEGDSEFITDITPASETRHDCNLCRLFGPEIANMNTIISKQKDQIAILTTRVNFLLSAWGLSENELSALNSGPEEDVTNGGVAGIDPTPAELADRDIDPLSAGQVTVSKDSGKLNYSNAVKKVQSSMVAAVHVEQRRIQQRNRNFVISGLSEVTNVSDKLLVEQFVAVNLRLPVGVVFCKRLGAPVHGKVQRLLISAESNEQAVAVIAAAKQLRLSPNPEIRKVFISQDLTAAEQRAAYELRCQRRSIALRRKGSGPGRQLRDSVNLTLSQATEIPVPAPVTVESQIRVAGSAVSGSVINLGSAVADSIYRLDNRAAVEASSCPLRHHNSGPGAQYAGAAGADATYAATSGAVVVPFSTVVTAATASTFQLASTTQHVGHSSSERSVLSASASSFVPFDALATDAADGTRPPDVNGRLAVGSSQ